jgi:hypothetical protein
MQKKLTSRRRSLEAGSSQPRPSTETLTCRHRGVRLKYGLAFALFGGRLRGRRRIRVGVGHADPIRVYQDLTAGVLYLA